MKTSDHIIPISYAKTNMAKVIGGTRRSRRPVVITQNGRGCAVLQDMQTFEETQESLAMLKIVAQGQRDIAAGRVTPLKKAFAEIRRATRRNAA